MTSRPQGNVQNFGNDNYTKALVQKCTIVGGGVLNCSRFIDVSYGQPLATPFFLFTLKRFQLFKIN